MEIIELLKKYVELKILFSIFLGLIVGLEREVRAKFGHDIFAGVRTFPLIAVLGTLSGIISIEFNFKYFSAIPFLGLILLASLSYYKDRSMGITTEVASFLTYFVGVLVSYDKFYLATFLTIVTTFILVLKNTLENAARRLEEEDIFAILKFFTISIVIFPLLPDKEIFPGLNLSEVWFFVILVSTVDFIGYFLLKYKGAKSVVITALIGGLVSSTAVTLAFSELSRRFPQYSRLLFFSIMVSWLVMFFRLFFYSTVVYAELFPYILKHITPYFLLLLGFTLYIYVQKEKEKFEGKKVEMKNPYSLKQALTFGVLYSIISVSSTYLKQFFGEEVILAISFLSGVIDIDAITLSLANLSQKGNISLEIASIGILTASISNNIFKSIYGIIFGNRELKKLFTFPLLISLLYLLLLLVF